MCRALLREILLVCAAVAAVVSTASGEPVTGVDAAGTIPLSTYKRTVNAGGAIDMWGGYGLSFNDWLWGGLILDPRFIFFSADPDVGKATQSTFSLTAGPRLTARLGDVEGVLDFRGGLYTDLGGPLHDTNGGWNTGGGISYYLVPNTSLGIFARYEHTGQRPAPGVDADRQYLSTGLEVQHRFLQPPPPVAQVSAPAVVPPVTPKPKQKLVLRGVHFDFGKADLRPDARPVLDEAIHTLKEFQDVDISVDGYTDSIGSVEYNQGLSQRRAQAVADYLAKGGIARSRMTVRGFGKADPVASNDTADGRAQNRRVELRVQE